MLRFILLGKILQQHARAMPAALRDVLGHAALWELLREGEAEQCSIESMHNKLIWLSNELKGVSCWTTFSPF